MPLVFAAERENDGAHGASPARLPFRRRPVDVVAARIFKSGRAVSVEAKAFKVLVFLLEAPQRLIEKRDLLDAVWGETYVTENVCVLGSEKAAWFKDTEGNILCIHQDM